MDISPVDLARLRSETLQFIVEHGATVFERAIKGGFQRIRPDLPDAAAAARLADEEAHRVRRAELFHVSEPMMQVAKAAGASLPEFAITPEDLPGPWGFAYFAGPVEVVEHEEGDYPIVAASWGPWSPDTGVWPNGGIWITWYSDAHAQIENAIRLGKATAEYGAKWRAATPRLAIDSESLVPFSLKAAKSADGNGPVYESVLRSVWLLMGQPLASVDSPHYDRAARRRYQREGVEPPEVRVITLRRPRGSSGEPSDSGREYHHQWIVRGHWRQQWYATRQVHRPVWIAPHIKGPEGAPVLGGEKVHALKH